MSDIEQIELEHHRRQIVDDVGKLVQKYRRIFDWDVPENDDAEAKKLILQAIREALDSMDV
jgi:predicted amidohydrolase